ncbi:hypothetical protein AKG07_13840 [Microbacterium sp. CGR1]|nr:hypothetical protein AKG07_13840 [Microbacterium sp. CGR1]
MRDARFETSTRQPSHSYGAEENSAPEDGIVDTALRIADLLRIDDGQQETDSTGCRASSPPEANTYRRASRSRSRAASPSGIP